MAKLSTPALCLAALYRLVGTTTSDDALVENGESANDVAYLCLNHGMESAQRFMIACGMTERWRTRSQAITSWSGADSTDGGRYKDLSSLIASGKEFLRFSGKKYDAKQSSLTEANGERWGIEIDGDTDTVTGDYFYLKNEQLWLAKDSAVPATVYLDYQFRHPEFTSSVTLNFPVDAMGLVIAYGARFAMADGWFPRDNERAIERNVQLWEMEARMVARRSRGKRRQNPPRTLGRIFVP